MSNINNSTPKQKVQQPSLRQLLTRAVYALEDLESRTGNTVAITDLFIRIADTFDQLDLDLEDTHEAIETLTAAVNTLIEAVKDLNTIKIINNNGDDGIKIWPRGEVKIISPVITGLSSKQARSKRPTATDRKPDTTKPPRPNVFGDKRETSHGQK